MMILLPALVVLVMVVIAFVCGLMCASGWIPGLMAGVLALGRKFGWWTV